MDVRACPNESEERAVLFDGHLMAGGYPPFGSRRLLHFLEHLHSNIILHLYLILLLSWRP